MPPLFLFAFASFLEITSDKEIGSGLIPTELGLIPFLEIFGSVTSFNASELSESNLPDLPTSSPRSSSSEYSDEKDLTEIAESEPAKSRSNS